MFFHPHRAAIIVMFITNEQISSAINQSPIVVRSALKDVETFLKDAHQQVTHTMNDGINSATERIQHNLEGQKTHIM
jgi:hypothetical protein